MQDDDTLKCLKGRIKYIFEDKLKYILIENDLGDTPTKQFVIPKALREKVNVVSSYPEWPHRQGGCLTCCGCTFEFS